MLTHRAFQAHAATRYTFAILGSMAVQRPVIEWVADHRKHHAHTDREGDPHSPHVGHGGGVRGALTGLLWGGFARIFVQHRVTWSVNSICHFFGRRRFSVEDESTNVFWLALPSLGESWHHHHHHAFPRWSSRSPRRGRSRRSCTPSITRSTCTVSAPATRSR
jgi:stearoyl-CoA desaturase (delta-9 desaturase)